MRMRRMRRTRRMTISLLRRWPSEKAAANPQKGGRQIPYYAHSSTTSTKNGPAIKGKCFPISRSRNNNITSMCHPYPQENCIPRNPWTTSRYPLPCWRYWISIREKPHTQLEVATSYSSTLLFLIPSFFKKRTSPTKVPLLPYQKQGLAWLLSRESKTAKPRGGILAGKQNIWFGYHPFNLLIIDAMGLGKTVTGPFLLCYIYSLWCIM